MSTMVPVPLSDAFSVVPAVRVPVRVKPLNSSGTHASSGWRISASRPWGSGSHRMGSCTSTSSSATRDDATLEQAQRYKLDRICRKLQLRPDDHIIEIGSGWGGFALHAASHYGCRVTTTTLSREQFVQRVIEHVRELQRQAPSQVHVLMGNHEILALGRYRFPRSKFADSWAINGGKRRDQRGFTDEHAEWLASLPLLGRLGDFLLMHSDTTEYLGWGSSIAEVNATVRDALADPAGPFDAILLAAAGLQDPGNAGAIIRSAAAGSWLAAGERAAPRCASMASSMPSAMSTIGPWKPLQPLIS